MPLTILDGQDAMKNLRAGRFVTWPDGRKSTEGRLGMRATVATTPKFTFDSGDTILTVGSCFAREIEKALVALGFNVPLSAIDIPREDRSSETANDIINKYVPQAMANELRWAFCPGEAFPEEAYLELEDGVWHDPHLGANIKPGPLERVKHRRRLVMDAYAKALQAKVVVVTLGLVEAWFDRQLGLYLNAAPPAAALARYPGRFEFHQLAYEDVVRALDDIYGILQRNGHPEFRMILTVSPVPFKATFTGRDALIANMYSKSVLRAAAENFCGRHANVDYFPSYEIVMHSDRAAAFYMDNIHVRQEMVDKIMAQVVRQYTGATPVPLPETGSVPKPADINAVSLYQYAVALARNEEYLTAAQVMRAIEDTFGDASSGVSRGAFHTAFGVWLLRGGQPVVGEEQLRKAVALDPTDARTNYKYGLALTRLKRNDEAMAAFEKSIALAPSVPDYHWRIGVEFSRLRRRAEAIAAFRRALQIDPDHERAKASLVKAMGQEPEEQPVPN